MSSERFREGLLSAARRPAEAGQYVSGGGRGATSAGPPHGSLLRSARWQPQNWPLRTKLLALTVVPLLLALVLGALRISAADEHSGATALRDSLITGAVAVVAVVVLVMLARSILKPLPTSSFDVAGHRRPAVSEVLHTSEGRVGDGGTGPGPPDRRPDLERVARAFDATQSEVVRLAAERDALRANVNDMLVNLSRRSQSLVERQLALIDELELGEQDPDRLAALFRLDHLATRMRRNGENLLVLAGADLRQRSGEPVPIVDVLRAAVSEIEDYQRVAMYALPRSMVSGLVVKDVIHLVAELLDNATAYSNPESQVTLGARAAQDAGLAVEISDAGPGIPHTRLAAINRRLAAPQAVDVAASRQMGLFVVGRLANRRGLQVFLTGHEGPGITATVILPSHLISAESPAAAPRQDIDNLARLYLQPAEADPLGGTAAREPFAPRPTAEPDPLDATQFWPPPEPLPVPTPAPIAPPPVAQPDPLETTQADQPLAAPSSYAPPAPADLLGDVPEPSTSTDPEDTPIFRAMLSRWFTEPAEQATPADDTAPAGDGWESEADAGWQAAKAASEPTAEELTAAGLPKRRPQAFLVPGSVGSGVTIDEPGSAPKPTPTPTSNPVTRDADAIRGRMASYQQGLARGRHAGPATAPDELPTSSGLGRHSRSFGVADDTGSDDQDEQTSEGTL